ncbi:NR LBD domain-containing protein [Caenorhabditis elegans]|uniref:NR LBD domain-containing protein n=3 Tax=Caenorhabditis elegans TaxID=6239 RepID=A0A1X7RCX1_CAEEL|nr:NR LBD domain-containing protein [Caenorhabditis elegans]SMQ11480.1 NR LBD domain-containing protein [Caenorhabditis elegans]|eukprot:NP_001338843.1 Uncharacterized protein CELE_Y61A9LA.3 [Caenorhabditis elegans]
MAPSRRKESFSKTLKECFEKFKSSGEHLINSTSLIPKNSMAMEDLRRGKIITLERMQKAKIPSYVFKAIATEARAARPLMSLNLQTPPPPVPKFFQQQQPQKIELKPPVNQNFPPDEKQIDEVLKRTNGIFQKISEILKTPLLATVDRRNIDNSTCLFTYLQGFPWALTGGMVALDTMDINKPPPPQAIYQAARIQFFQSLHTLIPPPIFGKMRKCVDSGNDMDWCMQVISSDDFREILQRVVASKINPIYSILWSTKPMDYDPTNQEFSYARSALFRQVEAEVRSFWTYEKIGVYLKMYFKTVE